MRRALVLLVSATTAAGLLAGCGSDSNSSSGDGASTPTQPAAETSNAVSAADGKVTVDANEYAFDPKAITAKPGKLEITLDNKGKIPHELVVLKTDEAPGSLKISGGRVSEDASIGEVSEIDGGGSKSATVDVQPGKYVYVCNIPGHYGDGMRGQITVK
jgi:plastocyanin